MTGHATRIVYTLTGVVTGAFVARLALEWSARPWPWSFIVATGALLAGLGGLIARRLARAGRSPRDGWPLLLLALYVVWPQRQPALALQLLALTALTLFLNWTRWNEFANLPICKFIDGSTFILALALYAATAAPGVLPADSGEFQIAAPLLGVAHPPGYPLYTLAGWLVTRLVPFGSAAYRLNLLSAFLAAGTLTLLSAATRRWARQLGAPPGAALLGGLVAALTLGTATTFWAQAGSANIRLPTAFLAALALYALARHAEAVGRRRLRPEAQPEGSAVGPSDRWLGLLALALSLGLGHHPSLAFLGLFILIYLFWIDPRLAVQPRRWGCPLLLASIALLPLLYLPLRGAAGAPLAPPDLDTPSGFWHHVTAQGFEGDMFYYANAQELPGRLALLPTLFRLQFNPLLLAAAGLGALLLAWRDRRLLLLLAGGLVLHTLVSITYRAPQTVEYLMPAYLPLAILAGLATAWLHPRHRSGDLAEHGKYLIPNIQLPLAALILLAALANGLSHAPSFFTLARDRSTQAYVDSILDPAPPGALVLADWRWATPLWYARWVEGRRPDVEVQYVYPVAGQEEGDTWRDRIEASVDQRPLLLTHFYDLPAYTLEPLGRGFWVHRRPYDGTPAGLTPLDAVFGAGENRLRLLGYRLERPSARPGETLELTLAWQPLGALTDAPSFSAQILGGETRLAADDRFLGTAYAPGEVRFERLVLPLYPKIPPGEYQLALQVYSSGAAGFQNWRLPDGATRLDLAALPVLPDETPPLSLHPLALPFSSGPTLVGVDYDRSVPGTLRLYLHWRGPAVGGEQVHVGERAARLPPLPGDAYQTTVLDLPTGTGGPLRLTLTGADGQAKEAAGPWGWPLRALRLPAPAPTARYVPLGGELALVGVAPSGAETVTPGAPLTVRLSFLALQPLVQDYGVSVRLLDEAGGLRGRHDLQPALGALPTLKWVQGARVADPHPLDVPGDLTGDVVRATLVVYERFRGTPLKPLDGRMGEVSLGEWAVIEP